MFHDDDTDVMQENISYSIDVSQNGKTLSHLSATNQYTDSGHAVKSFEFDDRGSVTLRIYDINLDDGELCLNFKLANLIAPPFTLPSLSIKLRPLSTNTPTCPPVNSLVYNTYAPVAIVYSPLN